MKKFLFIIFTLVFLCASFLIHIPQQAFADTPVPPSIAEGSWLPDADVTFQGKTASRSALLMNLVLTNYQWVNTGVNGDAPLISFWTKIRNIVYGVLLLVLLVAAFSIIISGGKNLTAWMFARRFIIMLILIWFSYALCRFLYEFVDIIIGFFNRNPEGAIITSKDLFNMSFNYDGFLGLRRFGVQYNESAFVSLLLVRLTAITYYVMAGILIVRKIILWFFIAISPIYPLLLFHIPIKNTAKIWIGEFFRWLLYAPLFFIFLSSLVVIWRSNLSIFPFNFAGTNTLLTYPTSINILLGGPGQQLTIQNSINYNDTFAEYIIALIMLWIVIFLPFVLLRIFLDYLSNLSIDKEKSINYLQNFAKRVPGNQFLFPNTPPFSPSSPPPSGIRPAGMAKPILYKTTGVAKSVSVNQSFEKQAAQAISKLSQSQSSVQNTYQMPVFKSERVTTETAKLVHFPIPRMQDIVRFETNRMSSQVVKHQEISKMHETLEKIANPGSITNTIEKQQFTQLREKLIQQSQKGEPLATSILNAAGTVAKTSQQSNIIKTTQQAVSTVTQTLQNIVNPESISNATEKQQFTLLRSQLLQASAKGDSYATTLMNTATNISHLSKQNKDQAVGEVQRTIEGLAHPSTITDATKRQEFIVLRQQLEEKSKNGDTVALSLLSAVDTVEKSKQGQAMLPKENQVQTVDLGAYEEVRTTWLENYKKMDVPKATDGTEQTRKQWIERDTSRVSKAIDLLNSKDQQKIDEGMKEVSNLLPFLLMGGFSQTEVIAYLQAKKHAAESAVTTMKDTETEEEETLVSARKKETQESKHMTASETLSPSDANVNNQDSGIVDKYTERMKTMKQPAMESHVADENKVPNGQSTIPGSNNTDSHS